MIQITVQGKKFQPGTSRFESPLLIGRDAGMHVIVPHWRVARRHAMLLERSHTLWIKDLGTWSGTWVNRKRVVADTPLLEEDEVTVGPLVFKACWVQASTASAVYASGQRIESVHDCALSAVDSPRPGIEGYASGGPESTCAGRAIVNVGGNADADADADASADLCASANACASADPSDSENPHLIPDAVAINGKHSLDHVFSRNRLKEIDEPKKLSNAPECDEQPGSNDAGTVVVSRPEDHDTAKIRQRLQAMLFNALDLRREDVSVMSDQHLRARAQAILEALIDKHPDLCPADRRAACIKAVIDEAVGLGPLEPLLAEDSISEIMVNRHDEIYVERAGCLERVDTAFANEMSVLSVLERIVAPLGRRIDEGSPMVDARLSDGSRVNGVIAPIALKGPTLTIRKFARRKLTLADLVAGGSLSKDMAAFLTLCVAHKKNVVVSGGTGSGKTTLLNILSGLIGVRERIITIEDAAELKLPHDHVVALEARPANIEGRGRVEIRDLVRNALRMRPDRIVVGECRGAEAFDMLAAMNTGHEGSLTTLHANTPRDALSRLETMILMTGMPLPLAAVREHISSGIDIIVQQARLDSGRRVLTDIAEVTGMDSGGIQLQTLFSRHKGHGRFSGAGVLPSFVDAWRERGIDVPPEWFDRS